MKPRAVLFGVVSLVTMGAVIWYVLVARHPELASSVDERGASTIQSPPSDVATESGQLVPVRDAQAREQSNERSVSTRTIHGVVRDQGRRPVEGADVRWTPLLDEFNCADWSVLDWEQVDRVTLATRSDRTGQFQIALPEDLDSRLASAIWVIQPSSCAICVTFDSIAATVSDREILLPKADAATVLVDDGNRAPVADAQVELFVHRPLGKCEPGGSLLDRALHVFHWRGSTREQGSVLVPSIDTDGVLVARKDSRMSRPKVTPIRGTLRLTLAPTFQLSGQVRLGDGAVLMPGPTVAVGLASVQGTEWIGYVRVRTDSSFGPDRWPVVESLKYAFCACGGNFLSQVVHRSPPKSDENVVVDFDLQRARACAVRVLDHEHGDVPIEGAIVQLWWAGELTTADVSSAEISTGVDGVAHVPGPSRGGVEVVAWKIGFAPVHEGPFTLRDDDDSPIEIRLRRGGTIEGTVESLGKPVESFEIAFWPNDLEQFRIRDFEGAEDGRFRIEDVPIDRYLIYATSNDQPRSEVATLDFKNGIAGPVTLSLPRSLAGVGQVIDGQTRNPLTTATVESWNSYHAQILTPQGSLVHVDSEGRFRVVGLRPGTNCVWIKADGYPSIQPSAIAEDNGSDADFGTVAMLRGSPVTFQLTSATPIDFTKFTLETHTMLEMAPTFFSADGVMKLGEFLPGGLSFGVGYPDHTTVWDEFMVRRLAPTNVVHRVRDDVELALSVRAAAGCDLPNSIHGSLAYTSDGTLLERSFSFAPTQPLTLANLPTGSALLALSSDESFLLRKHVQLGPDRQQTLAVDVNCRSRVLRFVDQEGEPCSGCTIEYGCVNEHPRFDTATTSDAEGRATIPDPDCDRVVISISGRIQRYGLEVALDATDPPEQVVHLGPDATLRVRVLDGSEPVRAIWVWCEETNSGKVLRSAATDSNGVASWADIREAKYRLVFDAQGLWHADAIVASTLDANPTHDVQVRRIGGVEFEVRGSLGEPLSGATVELVSNEFAANVSTWIADGRVTAPKSGLATDVNGKLALDGLPHGDYAWTVQTAEGKTMTGSVTVPIGSRAAVLAVAP